VIEKRSLLMHGEFVSVGFARRDGPLADERYAVLLDGDFDAVPVHGRAFRKTIFDEDANAVALCDLNRGTGATAVVTPDVERFPRDDSAF